MNVKYITTLEALANSHKCSPREAALKVCYDFYVKKGNPLDKVKEFIDWNTDEEIFRIFEYIQEYEAMPKSEHTPPFRFLSVRSGGVIYVWIKPGNKAQIFGQIRLADLLRFSYNYGRDGGRAGKPAVFSTFPSGKI